MLMDLQPSAVYGPIHSRRLGTSLGINILPCTMKFCLSDCIYCQYGHTHLNELNLAELPPAHKLLEEIGEDFRHRIANGETFDNITFSGNGEATLHPEFHKIVRGVKALRDHYFRGVPLCILSDSTQVLRRGVQFALMEFDQRYMKLDAGDVDTYEKINPAMGLRDLDHIVESLALLCPLTLQSLFITAPVNNMEPEVLAKWIRCVETVRPEEVHIYSIARGTAEDRVRAASAEQLAEVAHTLERQTGIKGNVF